MNKLRESKVFRDPLYGYITIEDNLIYELINTKEMQRLKRIKQLGGVSSVFHTAEHSRFAHSLGTYHLAYTIVSRVEDVRSILDERDKLLLYASALLHDLGHGPFSHAFEECFNIDHEKYSAKIILEKTEVNAVLKTIDEQFPLDVANIILKKTNKYLIQELVSSQLDVDRLDYLCRDAYFTGAKYGEVDVDRIIRTMKVKDNHIVHKSTSVIAIEDYLMSRYNMYWQVYFHPTGRSYEIIISNIYKRIRVLYDNGYKFSEVYRPLLKLIVNPDIGVEDYLRIDDHVVFNIILESENSDDIILSDLSKRIIHRHLFKDMIIKNSQVEEKVIDKLKEKGFDLEYYFFKDNFKQSVYQNSFDIDDAKNILIIDSDSNVHKLQSYSKIISALTDLGTKEENRIYYPEE